MKIKNLKEGQVIKNYKELCTVLEIKVSSGNTKIKQLNELQMYCNFVKDKNKFIINEIYETPILMLDRTNNKYIDLIANILISYLHTKDITTKKSITLTAGNMMEILGLVNENYNIGNRHKRELSQVLNIDILSVYYFYNNTRNEFKNIISRSLKSLKNRRVLDYQLIKTIYTKDKKYIEATEEDISLIIDIEKIALNKLGLKNFKEVFLKCKLREFQKIVKKLLPTNWIYYFDSYKIYIGEIALKIEYENMNIKQLELNRRALERTDTRLKLNDTMKDLIRLKDNLISLIMYDLDLADNIILKYNENKKEIFDKINKKNEEIHNIYEEIEEIKESNNKDIDEIEYSKYIEMLHKNMLTDDNEVKEECYDNIPF